MLVRPYEMPWRPAYELWAGAAWARRPAATSCTSAARGLLTATLALAPGASSRF